MRLSSLSAACPMGLVLLLLLGCPQSSSDVTFATPLDGSLDIGSPDASTGDSGQDADQLITDSQLVDLALPDAQVADSALPDTDLSVDTSIIDMQVVDMNTGTPADSMLPPASCVNRPDRSCVDICQSLTQCLVGDGCLGIDDADAQSLRASCEETCGFNTATRTILCRAERDDCTALLDTLYESDSTLNALCNFDDAFTEAEHDACRSVCNHTNLCLGQSGGNLEPPQACRFQCLSSGSYATADCVTALPCDGQFEQAAQACLQGRRTYPPLVTDCTALCMELAACEPDGRTIFGAGAPMDCADRCAAALGSPQEIACVGLAGCSANDTSISRCVMENAAAPSCALSCQRILECSAAENPFGVTEANLATCTERCLASTNASQRRCSFDTACDENFVNNFNSCGTE